MKSAVCLLAVAVACVPPAGRRTEGTAGEAIPSAPAVPEEAPAQPASRREGGVRAFVGGRVLDGYGGPPIENAAILVRGDRIAAVAPAAEVDIPEDAEIVSTEGMTLLPGLIDMHVHLMLLGHGDYERWDRLTREHWVDLVMPLAARQLLEAGVTTARDLGAPPAEILEVRRRIRAGEIRGPRLFVAGPFLQEAPYEPWEADYRWGVSSAAEARRIVRELAREGVDAIKLIDQDRLADDVVAEIVRAAHEHGLPVVAHAHRAEEIRVGLRHGVDDFEHTGLGTAPGYPEDVLEGLRRRNAGLYWTPTLSPLLTMRESGEVFAERLDDPRWREGMPDWLAEEIRGSLRRVTHLPYYALFPSRIPTLAHKFQQLRQTGVQLLVGTDSGIPTMFHNDSTWRELAVWVELGVPPMQALQAATLWPARALGAEADLGVIAAGHYADFIGVRGDPLRDIRLLRHVALVVKGGERVR